MLFLLEIRDFKYGDALFIYSIRKEEFHYELMSKVTNCNIQVFKLLSLSTAPHRILIVINGLFDFTDYDAECVYN